MARRCSVERANKQIGGFASAKEKYGDSVRRT